MLHYTYLAVDFFAVIICFIFSFHTKIRFDKLFTAFIKTALIVGIPFCIWDIWFAQKAVWWFNDTYILGIRFWGLPLEEYLFFICIPFSCLFTYVCLTKFFGGEWLNAFNNILVFILAILCSVILLLYHHKLYTAFTAAVLLGSLLYLHFVAKAEWLGQATVVYIILMLGFFPVNGILTGTGLKAPIVNYNPKELLNIRLLTIPVEDFFYGYANFLLNLYFFKLFSKKIVNN